MSENKIGITVMCGACKEEMKEIKVDEIDYVKCQKCGAIFRVTFFESRMQIWKDIEPPTFTIGIK